MEFLQTYPDHHRRSAGDVLSLGVPHEGDVHNLDPEEQLCHFAKSPSFLASAQSYTFTLHLHTFHIQFSKNRHFLGIFAKAVYWKKWDENPPADPRRGDGLGILH